MTLALAFAILMLLWIVFGLWPQRPGAPAGHQPFIGSLLAFFLFLLLGWQVFGPLLHR